MNESDMLLNLLLQGGRSNIVAPVQGQERGDKMARVFICSLDNAAWMRLESDALAPRLAGRVTQRPPKAIAIAKNLKILKVLVLGQIAWSKDQSANNCEDEKPLRGSNQPGNLLSWNIDNAGNSASFTTALQCRCRLPGTHCFCRRKKASRRALAADSIFDTASFCDPELFVACRGIAHPRGSGTLFEDMRRTPRDGRRQVVRPAYPAAGLKVISRVIMENRSDRHRYR